MQGKKKVIGNMLFLTAVFALTVYGVFHGEDLGGNGSGFQTGGYPLADSGRYSSAVFYMG